MLVLDLPSDLAALGPAQDRIEDFATAAGLPQAAALRLRLVVEELVANLAMHAAWPEGQPAPLRLTVTASAQGAALELADRAAPFDPRATPDPDGPPSLEADAPPGGLGLALLRRMATRLDYGRDPDGTNRTRVWIAA